MKILPFILVIALFGCSRPELPSTRLLRAVQEWVPEGTPLSSAQKIMEEHQFTCTVHSFTNRLMMTNHMEAVCWGSDGVRALGVRDDVVTNVTLLECQWTDIQNTSKCSIATL